MPAGAMLRVEAVVNAGKDKTASSIFQYQPGDLSSVSYKITGQTLTNQLQGPIYSKVDPATQSRLGFVTLSSVLAGFVCKPCFRWYGPDGKLHETRNGRNLTADQQDLVDPGDLGVPDGALCFLKVIVVAGRDREAPDMFIYQKGAKQGWAYNIGGTTLDAQLSEPSQIGR